MDKDVITEFTKSVAVGSLQLIAFVAAVFLAVNVAIWLGMDPEATVPVVMIGLLVAMMIWIGLSNAWNSAKRKVEYKRKWGEDL